MEKDMHICHYIICYYCTMITIFINVRFRFSIDNTTDHLIILKKFWDNIVYRDKFYFVIEIQVFSLSHSPSTYTVLDKR